jgi:hypothetical protein
VVPQHCGQENGQAARQQKGLSAQSARFLNFSHNEGAGAFPKTQSKSEPTCVKTKQIQAQTQFQSQSPSGSSECHEKAAKTRRIVLFLILDVTRMRATFK